MRRVKLVVSDFHIGTGRYRPDGTRNPIEDFYFGEKFVEFLEYHRTGEFHDAEVELIINGDFFNLLQLSEVAPDGDLFTERVCVDLLKHVFTGHEAVFDALAHFNKDERRSITFVMGNHDPGLVFDGVQRLLRERIGGRIAFYVDHYDFDEVHVEHGNQFDALNAFDTKRLFLTRGLPEPVVNLPWGSQYLIHVMTREKERRPWIDKVTPHRRFLRWAVFNDTRWFLAVAWRSFLFLLRSVFVPRKIGRFKLTQLIRSIWRYHPSPTLEKEARAQIESHGYKTVVYGHTHVAMFREYDDGSVYVNSGSWNHVTSLDLGSLGRLVRLTYAFLEWDDGAKRWVPHLREWKGYHRVVEELYR